MATEEVRASVIIPLYRSWNTLEGCLQALAAQTEKRFEIILIDSSEDDRTRAIAQRYDRTVYLHSSKRLRPQAARNLGAQRARGELLLFTDPDIYPAPNWVETLTARHRETPAILFGPIACHGRRWVDLAVHFVKFNICLPGGDPRPVRLGWSGNVLISRQTFDALGGWDEEYTQGDSTLSARARAADCELRMEPEAVVYHDHERVTVGGLLRERFFRGREFARMEAAGKLGALPRGAGERVDVAKRLAVMPLRALAGFVRVGRAAAVAGMLGDFVLTSPVVFLGVASWYAGLASGWRGAKEG